MECSPSNNNSPASITQNIGEYIAILEKTNREQAQTIVHLHSQISELKIKIIELEARLGLNSANSSFPPSRDIVPPPKPVSLRKKSGKKAGGQKNVKG